MEIIENNSIWNDLDEGRNNIQFSDNGVSGGRANSRGGVFEVEEDQDVVVLD